MDNTNFDKRVRDNLSSVPTGSIEAENLLKSDPSHSPRSKRDRQRNSSSRPALIATQRSETLALSNPELLQVNRRAIKKKLKQLTIRQVAEEIFLGKLYREITVDEIAKRAGVTKRTLYKYFPSKLALYVYMFDDFLQQLHLEISKTAELNLPTYELLLKLVDVLHSFTKKNEKFMHLYWMVDSAEFDGAVPQELVARVNVWTASMFRVTVEVVKRGQMEGIIMDGDPELLVHSISAINKGIFTHTRKERGFEVADIDPDTLHKILLNILNQGLFKASKEVRIESK